MAAAELDLLKTRFDEQRSVYTACARQTQDLWWVSRLLVQGWLAEIELMLAQLERRIVQLASATSPVGMDSAWRRYYDVLTALSPAAPSPGNDRVDVAAIGWRLQVVLLFLVLQIAFAIVMIGATVQRFRHFDPQTTLTREQWEERAHARAEIARVSADLERAAASPAAPAATAPLAPATPAAPAAPAAAPGAPELSMLRGEVEGLVSTLSDMRLAERDLRLANLRIDSVLVGLDKEPPDYAGGAKVLRELEASLTTTDGDAPPGPMPLILLGSLLGMITITIHLNWKFRNRWDTIGFLPWYVTRLVSAPVLSWAALGLLFQVSFTQDLAAAGGSFGALGLRGASPMLIFSISIVTGLFSNLVFDWLRLRITATQTATRSTTAPSAPAEDKAAAPE
jgi:hypothetical protein